MLYNSVVFVKCIVLCIHYISIQNSFTALKKISYVSPNQCSSLSKLVSLICFFLSTVATFPKYYLNGIIEFVIF